MGRKVQNQPEILVGDIFKDFRGEVGFVNSFDFKNVKRFYTLKNTKKNEVRAWHGHKNEAKYVHILTGKVLFGAVGIDNWIKPSKKLQIYKFTINGKKPSILYIPPGFANGFQSLTKNAKLIIFSTSSLNESLKDDIKFDKNYWNIWR